MDLQLREEQPKDYREVEEITRKAFWNQEKGGCDEHLLAHLLRKDEAFVQPLSIVAVSTEGIVGNIMYAKSFVQEKTGARHPVLTFGPLSVLPAVQGKGVGAALVCDTLKKAKKLGYTGVVIFGHPSYYPRFGFKNAAYYGITTWDGQNMDAFMAAELYPGSLQSIHGRFFLPPVYQNLPASKVAHFDKGFL